MRQWGSMPTARKWRAARFATLGDLTHRNFTKGLPMNFSILGLIEKIIVEHGSAAALKERLALVRDKVEALEANVVRLEKENSQLAQRCEQLQKEAACDRVDQQYVEGRGGAYFKKRTGGGYVLAVYCPSCKQPASDFPPGEEFHCDPCRWHSTFTARELTAVIAELP